MMSTSGIVVLAVAMALSSLAATGSPTTVLSLRLPPPLTSSTPSITVETSPTVFPPGGRFSASRFWAASPILPLANGPERDAADFVASGESAMLGWAPPPGAARATPLSDSHSLVRLLGGGSSAAGTPGKSPNDGDVVLRNAATGALVTQWPLLWSRLDPWVNNSVPAVIVVLDNVPFAFCKPGACSGHATYGNDMGPANVTEYRGWIETILSAMVRRYGHSRAAEFWFRVGTEPNTQPGHWNDTNAKCVRAMHLFIDSFGFGASYWLVWWRQRQKWWLW
jgi:hypothetical protein